MAPMNTAIACSGMTRLMRRALMTVVLTLLGTADVVGIGRPPLVQAAQSEAAVPVVAGEVRRADVPIYLTGIGTVQAFNSVLVKARVDGQIVKIDFTEGQDVAAGDVLAEIDPAPLAAALAQTQAAKLKDEAQLDNARRDLGRATRLAASGNATIQQQDTARSLVAQLEATVKADQAAIDAAQVQLNYTRIRSPISGRAGVRMLDVGNIVHATDATGIVTVNQIHPIFVSFSLPADTLPRLRAAMKNGDVEVGALSKDGRQFATGRLGVIDNQINTATATIGYKAAFENSDDALWPGQFVNVDVLVGTRHDAVTVPATAVLHGPDGTYAFVIGQDRRVAKHTVRVGWSGKDLAVIDDGLVPGEQVVTDGQYRIQSGSLVQFLPSTEPTGGRGDRAVGAGTD
jgi:multidrug efflux system membrane fusion protein